MTGTGTVDLATKSLAFRVEPKLVMTIEGQGGGADPVGLGIPVVVDGPWTAPRIYPDMAGILDNPDAAYAKLREMGNGLFGSGGGLTRVGRTRRLGRTDPGARTFRSLRQARRDPRQSAPAGHRPRRQPGSRSRAAFCLRRSRSAPRAARTSTKRRGRARQPADERRVEAAV